MSVSAAQDLMNQPGRVFSQLPSGVSLVAERNPTCAAGDHSLHLLKPFCFPELGHTAGGGNQQWKLKKKKKRENQVVEMVKNPQVDCCSFRRTDVGTVGTVWGWVEDVIGGGKKVVYST